ncbi:MAG: hypothetical protein A4E48_01518 [Methanosaeta sp. PtaU1.Bin060]|nr:MAG: hypothetical protein A4E48_01518 [Methanosaeta sp. PtaU1.Bin060]
MTGFSISCEILDVFGATTDGVVAGFSIPPATFASCDDVSDGAVTGFSITCEILDVFGATTDGVVAGFSIPPATFDFGAVSDGAVTGFFCVSQILGDGFACSLLFFGFSISSGIP